MLKPTIIFLLYFCISVANISAQKINPELENQQREEYKNALKAEQFLKAKQYKKVDSGQCLYVVKCAVITSEANYHELLNLYREFENGKLNNKNIVLSLTMSTQDLAEAYSGKNLRNVDYLLLKAQILYETKKFDDAKEKVFTVLQIDPNNTEALKLYKDLGSPERKRYEPFDITGKYVLSESRINLKDIYQNLENKKIPDKGEFETTAQFNKRKQEVQESTLLGDLKLNDYFEVPIERLIKIIPKIEYSADDGRMDISFSFGNYVINRASRYKNQEDYRILFNNSSDFSIYRKSSWSDEIETSLYFIPDVAKDVKPNLNFLAVMRLREPYVESLACDDCSHTINADLQELWIYDKRTGYVYEKILNIPERLSEAEAQFSTRNYKESLNTLNFIFPGTIEFIDTKYKFYVLKAKNYIELKKTERALPSLELADGYQELNLVTSNGRLFLLSLQKYRNLLTSITKISAFNKNFPNAGINPESYLLLAKLYKQKKDKINALKTINSLLKFYPKLNEALTLKREILIPK